MAAFLSPFFATGYPGWTRPAAGRLG